MLKPQNVKNMLTFLPSAAAAFAITKAAMALSRSPENTMKFLPLPADGRAACSSGATGPAK